MYAHGWVVSQYIPDPSRDDEDSVLFTDLSPGGKRGDADLQADRLKCDPEGILPPREYKLCMLSYGWHFYAYVPPFQPE